MYTRIAALVVLLLAFAAAGWKGYALGERHVQAQWDADIAQRTAQALAASEAARKREQDLNAAVADARGKYAKSVQNVHVVAAAAADGLRNLETILAAPATASSSAVASSGTNGAGGLERQLLGQCAKALAGMGAEADRLAAKIVALQDYVRAIQAK